MSQLAEKVKRSIERVKEYNPLEFGFTVRGGENKKYHLAFSGGKDSVAVKRILDLAGVEYDAVYRVTSVDPPELVQFIKDKYPDVRFEIPHAEPEWDEELDDYAPPKPITMWNLIPKKLMPPTRRVRYCCGPLKESAGKGGINITGVRWDESDNRRKNQGIITAQGVPESADLPDGFIRNKQRSCILQNDNTDTRETYEVCAIARIAVVNPIIDWTTEEVWEFIGAERCPYCGIYDDGFKRIGCIGCPMAGRHQREREFARWPAYKNLYLLAFDKMLKERERRGKITQYWQNAEDVYRWWMGYDELPGQIDLLEDYEA